MRIAARIVPCAVSSVMTGYIPSTGGQADTMAPFISMRGVKGQVFVPESTNGRKKHRCPDCDWCQWCGDTRCHLCLRQKACLKKRKNPR